MGTMLTEARAKEKTKHHSFSESCLWFFFPLVLACLGSLWSLLDYASISFSFKFLLTAGVRMTNQGYNKIYFSLVRMDHKGTFKDDMWLSLGKYETSSLTSPLCWILLETLKGLQLSLQTFSSEHLCPISSSQPHHHHRLYLASSPHILF